MALQFRQFCIIIVFFLHAAPQTQAHEPFWVLRSHLLCVADNADRYLSLDGSVITVVLPRCPHIDALGLATAPRIVIVNDLPVQMILPASRSTITCIGTKSNEIRTIDAEVINFDDLGC